MRPSGSAAELEARRRRAAEHFQERKPLREIASLVGVSLTSVKRWKRTWKAEGVEGLAAKPHPGPEPKLSEKQRQTLTKILLNGSVAAGYRTDLWTCARVSKVVRKQFDVSYHPAHMGRVLHDLGFSPQKPRRGRTAQSCQSRSSPRTAAIKKARRPASARTQALRRPSEHTLRPAATIQFP